MSRAQTSCPSSAKQAAVTRPTQPTPITPIGSLSALMRPRRLAEASVDQACLARYSACALTELPFPPVELANRTGWIVGRDGSFSQYEAVGHALREVVVEALPDEWVSAGKRVLDFGCGAGRTLRHFTEEARHGEFWGCDIDAPSVAWVNANLNPPIQAFVNNERPPLPRPDASFDLIYAFSVFSHLTDSWSSWLAELHRLLKPDGIFIASFLGPGMSEAVAGEPWNDDGIGMNVLHADRAWEQGGPIVLLSPWWIREHWGRAFDIERLDDGAASRSHGLIVARPKPHPPQPAELERIDPGELREIEALRHNIRQLRHEVERVTEGYEASHSWQLTAPLRAIRGRARQLRR
jgi:SAM-dependent methyltransferase